MGAFMHGLLNFCYEYNDKIDEHSCEDYENEF